METSHFHERTLNAGKGGRDVTSRGTVLKGFKKKKKNKTVNSRQRDHTEEWPFKEKESHEEEDRRGTIPFPLRGARGQTFKPVQGSMFKRCWG